MEEGMSIIEALICLIICVIFVIFGIIHEYNSRRCKEIATVMVKGKRLTIFRCRNKLFSFQKSRARTKEEWIKEHLRRIEYEE